MNLLQARDDCLRQMFAAGRNARDLGRKWAQAEADYQAAKWTTAAHLKADGYPATLIQATIKGHPEVNGKLLARDMAAVDYKSEQDAEQDLKKQACLIEDQIKREWTAAQ